MRTLVRLNRSAIYVGSLDFDILYSYLDKCNNNISYNLIKYIKNKFGGLNNNTYICPNQLKTTTMNFVLIESLANGHQQIYQSNKANNGDFDYRMFVSVIDYNQCSDLDGFGVDVYVAKTKKYISKDKLKSIADSYCIDVKDVKDSEIADYGLRANLDGHKEVIKTKAEALKIANEFIDKADTYKMLIGFYLDKAQNRIGNTGWDFLDGKIG